MRCKTEHCVMSDSIKVSCHNIMGVTSDDELAKYPM